MDYDLTIKTIIIGNSHVGKSNIMTKFVDDEFRTDFCSTIGIDYKVVRIDHKDKTIKLQVKKNLMQ